MEEGHNNKAIFEDFIESDRPAQKGECLVMTPKGRKETWFTDQKKLFSKTNFVKSIDIDGVIWQIRKPNKDPANIIQTFQYQGERGNVMTFYKPVWGTNMAIKRNSYIAWNSSNSEDVWAIEENAMSELYNRI